MKKKFDIPGPARIGGFILRLLGCEKIRPGPAAAAFAAFVVAGISVLSVLNTRFGVQDQRDLETGRVADRDVVTEKSFSFVDEEATRLRVEAEEKLVPAVFMFSAQAAAESEARWDAFAAAASKAFADKASLAAFALAVQSAYPGKFSSGLLEVFYSDHDRDKFAAYGASVLKSMYERGVFLIPWDGLGAYNPDMLELIVTVDGRTESERIPYVSVTTRDNAPEALNRIVESGVYPPGFALAAGELLMPFVTENVVFSPDDTRQRVAEARIRVEPVIRHIESGERVIRKGFIITDDDMRALRALNQSLPGRDPRDIVGYLLLLVLIFILMVFLSCPRVLKRQLNDAEAYLVAILSALYAVGSAFAGQMQLNTESFPISILLPTALMIMLQAILIGPRFALSLGIALPIGSYVLGFFDSPALIFALVSGVSASYTLEKAENRMDIIKAGLINAAANCMAVIAILLVRRAGLLEFPSMFFWAAFNGLACAMLVMGFLPVLEHAMNAATTFRLRELSDLNAPMLKKLFQAAPGTYSHSIMVANLAENACQDIGANPLLARVGAYYHDIGKMDNSEYFVENQNDYNPHDELEPRHSATIIKSHVQLGLEKARQIGLPRSVQEIIAEHHGDSLITWFYNKALKKEKNVSVEDYSYAGPPPRSRESAVVMLADVTEAACRTLKKPTAAAMDKFIKELFNAKVEHGQLTRSDLSFRDLETIKNAFVHVLASQYHSRIEYPKINEKILQKADEEKDAAKAKAEAGKTKAADTEAKAVPEAIAGDFDAGDV